MHSPCFSIDPAWKADMSGHLSIPSFLITESEYLMSPYPTTLTLTHSLPDGPPKSMHLTLTSAPFLARHQEWPYRARPEPWRSVVPTCGLSLVPIRTTFKGSTATCDAHGVSQAVRAANPSKSLLTSASIGRTLGVAFLHDSSSHSGRLSPGVYRSGMRCPTVATNSLHFTLRRASRSTAAMAST